MNVKIDKVIIVMDDEVATDVSFPASFEGELGDNHVLTIALTRDQQKTLHWAIFDHWNRSWIHRREVVNASSEDN